jgi:DNA-directed RNA polymerase specialized sigma24 family protein
MPSANPWETLLQRHSETCICKSCRAARRRTEYRRWAGHRPPLDTVPTDQCAAHIAQLRRMGWSQEQIARAAGVATGTVSQAKCRGVRILRSTAEAILALRPEQSRR